MTIITITSTHYYYYYYYYDYYYYYYYDYQLLGPEIHKQERHRIYGTTFASSAVPVLQGQ